MTHIDLFTVAMVFMTIGAISKNAEMSVAGVVLFWIFILAWAVGL